MRTISRRTRGAWLATAALAVMLASGCTVVNPTASPQAVSTTAPTTEPSAPPSSSAAPTTAPTSAPAPLPKTGQCVMAKQLKVVDCLSAHDAEITAVQALPVPAGQPYPDDSALLTMSMLSCRAALGDYLNSSAADATRLRASAIWPAKAEWDAGERFKLCTAIEIDPDNRPVSRTGTLRAALTNDAFYNFQMCTAGLPSKAVQLKLVPCNQPHIAEALPYVLHLGTPADKLPSVEELRAKLEPFCRYSVNAYLGTTNARPDLVVSWRMPGERDWAEGYTSAVCYVELPKPISSTVKGLGESAPLPG